jgi:hypothetical protein
MEENFFFGPINVRLISVWSTKTSQLIAYLLALLFIFTIYVFIMFFPYVFF